MINRSSMAVDTAGYPVLLAVSTSTASPKPESVVISKPSASIDPLEVARRGDAVRDAAREFEELSEQDLRERLRGATSRELTAAEVSRFKENVRAQVLDDLVDVLDQNRRGKLRSRRTVRVVAPRGYLRKAQRGLSESERSDVEERLRARGWTDQDVLFTFGSK
jgi:hypothetical protein